MQLRNRLLLTACLAGATPPLLSGITSMFAGGDARAPIAGTAWAGETTDLYIAPNGDDAADGTKEKPFATFAKARDASRAAPAGQAKRIVVLDGKYYDVALTLGSEDSGLTIEAAPGAKPILYGGIPLKNWEKDETFYTAKLPEGREWQIRMLQVDEKLCPRARYPAEGTLAHLTAFDVPWMSTTGGGWKRKPTNEESTTLKYKPADLGPWLNVKNAEITVYHMWDESCVGVAANNADTQTLTLAPACGHPPGAFGVKKYVLWNIREGLKTPGQWYHDRAQNRVVYFPLPGQDMSKAEAIVPATATIVRLRGTGREKIRNVTLRGLALSVATVPLVAAGFAAERFDGAVSLENAEDCLLSGLTVARVAGHGINAKGSISGVRVEKSEVAFCGAGGVYVGGSRSVITNNHVHDVGLFYPSAIGIFRGGKGNIVSYNEVHGCSYSAINYGGQENIIENNLLYDCMKTLHDGAAIYVFGAKNCILRGNLARDITDTGGYGASAYYLDEQCEGCIVEKNLSLRVGWPSQNHMAKKNTIRDNVFIVLGDAKITFPRSSEHVMERNVLYAKGKITITNPDGVTTWSKNLFFSGSNKIEGVKLKDYSSAGTVPGAPGDTVVGDPLFVDWEKGDYRYRPGSPALKLGLEPVDVSKVGREKE
jgi:hypothetical protein